MRRYLGSISLAAACAVVLGASATVHGDDLGSNVNRQLARARAATARYHDVEAAIADGYVSVGQNPFEGEAFEYVNFGLVDCTLDAQHPEALRYVKSGNGLRLIAVEYSIPMACPGAPPDDFLPGVGEWESEMVAPVWTLTAYIWSGDSR
jgi:hypothetical protein